MNDQLIISPPLYLMGKKIYCWRCDAKMTVVTLLAPHVAETENEVCVLSDVQRLPAHVLAFIQKRVPTYKLKFSKTVKGKYYANTCPACGVLSGDFFLQDEPGAPFFPTNEEEASTLYITEIPLNDAVKINASLGTGVGDLILENARKI